MIESKQDIKNAITSVENNSRYNASFTNGYVTAMKEVLDAWLVLYDEQRLVNAMEDAQDHLWNFLSREVCLTDDECDQRVDYAIEDGAIRRIARCFLNNHDCNVAENDQYYSIICNMYYDENQFH